MTQTYQYPLQELMYTNSPFFPRQSAAGTIYLPTQAITYTHLHTFKTALTTILVDS